ncbi:MAG: rRNA methyltransferase [Candidatus Omnitrophica bacterium]|nr:rRNA methyltransferase [Candidatus Omnitrophota bacterium]
MNTLMTCKEGFEKVLAREVMTYGLTPESQGQGWVLAKEIGTCSFQEAGGLCFAIDILKDVIDIRTTSVNTFTDNLLEVFLTHLGTRRIIDPWTFRFISCGKEQLIHHALTLQERWFEKLRKKMSRVAHLAKNGIPQRTVFGEGLFVCVTDFNQAYVSFHALSQGQQRMKMDPQAPSRSYLKIEEAFHILDRCPKEGETVIDLGAAPGGWSHGALKRGAMVIAVDNGPLREPVKSHPKINHLQADALTYQHQGQQPIDWLLCDVLETPEIIISMLLKWLSRKSCRLFIVNLKLGRRDPIAVLAHLRDPQKGLLAYCQTLYIRQLYHDREEITLMGEIKK